MIMINMADLILAESDFNSYFETQYYCCSDIDHQDFQYLGDMVFVLFLDYISTFSTYNIGWFWFLSHSISCP